MLKTFRKFFLATLLSTLAIAAAAAHGSKVGDLTIGHPWSRATPNGAKIGGGYLSVTNNGSVSDRLLGGSVSLADHVEIHEMKMDGGVMQMRQLSDGIEIKPGETVTFAPGGYHLMFMDLKAPLKEGEMVKGQLKFEKAGIVDVEFKVDAIGAMGKTSGDKTSSDKASGNMPMEHKH